MSDLLDLHFPELPDTARAKLRELSRVFREWNAKINLVSRKDIEQFEEHHLLHALAASKFIKFPPRTRVIDVGTGGGLPGLPLAICFPQTRFFLLDSVTKKANAVSDMVKELGVKNVEVVNKRAETLESTFHYVLGRAVTTLPQFLGWIGKNLRPGETEGVRHGVLYFKGTLYRDELASLNVEPAAVYDLHEALSIPYYEDKFLVHIGTEDANRVCQELRAAEEAAHPTVAKRRPAKGGKGGSSKYRGRR